MVRANTTRTGAITRVDAFGVLGEAYAQQVWVMENTGESKYDALNLSLEKRYSNNWSGRVSYSLSKSRGNAYSQADKNTYQFLTDLNLDQLYGPQDVDRRHVLSINGRTEIPKTRGITLSSTLRYMSGAPFTIYDSSIDVNQNGELDDPLPAGTYSGTALNAMTNVENKGDGATVPAGPTTCSWICGPAGAAGWAAAGRSSCSSTSSTSPTAPTGIIRFSPTAIAGPPTTSSC